MGAPSLTRLMADMVVETTFEAIPPAVIERAKISLIHNLVVGAAGRLRETVGHVMAERFWSTPAEATVLWDSRKASLEGAVFANAALMNCRSQDDTHDPSTTHPGSPTMAAALAVAEVERSSGADLLTAIVLGYEVLCRLGRDFDQLVTRRGFRSAALMGGFGAAAATAKLMRLSVEQTTHAFGLAANLCGGVAQVWREGSAEAPLQLAFAARNGVAAARAASVGAGAAVSAMDGESGFFRAYAGTTDEAVEATTGLFQDWQLLAVTVKPQPVCAILQGPLSVFLALVAEYGLTGDAVSEIVVVLNPYEASYPGITFGGPFASSIATKLSAPFTVALAVIDGRITMDGLHRLDDPRILALSHRVRVEMDESMANRCCRVSVRLADGRTLQSAVDTPVGQPDFPGIARFARSMAGEIGIATDTADRLISAVDTLERADDVRSLIEGALLRD